jgi:hypothetical protein
VHKEIGNHQRFIERAFENGYNHRNGPWMGSNHQTLDPALKLPSSYPIPCIRSNLPYHRRLKSVGYMNDSSATNPSDPSSMRDLGGSRNAVFNVKFKGLPDGNKLVHDNLG